ncbi:MAG TPA: hypothetical protein PKI89_05930, partial [Tepidiformaceae bacterium]|nr:hypothetical protein [Tepidiformaceae bacterium]
MAGSGFVVAAWVAVDEPGSLDATSETDSAVVSMGAGLSESVEGADLVAVSSPKAVLGSVPVAGAGVAVGVPPLGRVPAGSDAEGTGAGVPRSFSAWFDPGPSPVPPAASRAGDGAATVRRTGASACAEPGCDSARGLPAGALMVVGGSFEPVDPETSVDGAIPPA